jgi:hypothetical protein
VAANPESSNPGNHPRPQRQPGLALTISGHALVKAKVFEVMLHKLPSGKSPASELEDQLNAFLAQSPVLQVVATHMNTVVAPAEPNAMPSSEESTIIIFCTVFYTAA